MPDTDLTTDVVSGKVVGRLIKTVVDTSDPGVLPDEAVIQGSVKFTPLYSVYKDAAPNRAAVVPGTIVVDLDGQGYLSTAEGTTGLWLPVGPYKVNYRLLNARIRTHRIDVLAEHTEENPLNLTASIPPLGPVMTPGEYAALSARIDAIAAVDTDDPRLSDARTPLPHDHDDLYYTMAEADALLQVEVEARMGGDTGLLETIGQEITERSQSDVALGDRIDGVEATVSVHEGRIVDLEAATPDLSGLATTEALETGLAGKSETNHVHDDRYYTEDEVDSMFTSFAPDLSGLVTDTDLADAISGTATAAQGAKADTAVQPAALSSYATTSAVSSALAGKASSAQGAKADTAVQPAALSGYATSAQLASAGLWRGAWSALDVIWTPDLSAGVPSEFTTSAGWSTPTLPDPPWAAGSIRTLFVDNSVGGNFDASFTVPAGASVLDIWIILTNGSPGSSTLSILKNGSVAWGPAFQTEWAHPTLTVAPGDVITLRSTASGYLSKGYFGNIRLMGIPNPYMTGHTVTHLGRMWKSTANNNATTPGSSGTWVDLDLVVDPTDIAGSTSFGRSVLTAANLAAIGAATSAQGTKADTAVQPADLSAYATDAEVTAALATLGSGGAKWRGVWSSIALIKAYDPVADGIGVGSLTGVVNIPTPLASIARVSALITTGDLPLAANVYRYGLRQNGVPSAAWQASWNIPAPAGTTEVRFKHAHATGPGFYGQDYVYVNGVLKRTVFENNLPWLAQTYPITPGQLVSFYSATNSNVAGEGYVGDLEFWGTAAPYLVGDLVFYKGRFYICASTGTTSTPGTDSTWTPLSGSRDLRWYCPPLWTTIDEFNDDTRDAAYTNVYPAGRSTAVAWTEFGDVQSAALAGGGSVYDLQALMRPLSGVGGAMANGDAIVVGMEVRSNNTNANYIMAGIVLADGVTPGAGNQLVAWFYSSAPSNLACTTSLWAYTNYGAGANLTADTPPTEYDRYVYMRIVRISSTTWRTDWSPDGASWVLGTVGTLAITPTHVGVGASSFGTATKGFASFDFIRRVSGVS